MPADPIERLMRTLARHVRDERVLEAVRSVPRDAFVPPELREDAWENVPLPIGAEQTISQPLVVARMLELLELEGSERVLDVGTGSGYHAALLARLAAHVWSIEVHAELSARAATALAAVGVENVTLRVGDGSKGWPEAAPYDAINVAAAALDAIPEPLFEQLGHGGRLVAPVERGDQYLVLCRRTNGDVECVRLERVRFVPLI
jgi:protein-L-isoaspartate(D-aspartate) O-methyltransferase